MSCLDFEAGTRTMSTLAVYRLHTCRTMAVHDTCLSIYVVVETQAKLDGWRSRGKSRGRTASVAGDRRHAAAFLIRTTPSDLYSISDTKTIYF